MPSYYCPALNSIPDPDNVTLVLEGDEAWHLAKVLHARPGERIRLNSGAGVIAEAQILEVGKSAVRVEILSHQRLERAIGDYAIAFSLLKNKHDELLVEKCAELGARVFFPLTTAYSVRQASSNTIPRFAKIALAAIKQCDSPWLPSVQPARSLANAIDSIVDAGYRPIVCSERRPELWLHHLSREEVIRPCFLIGPEGGWSEEEYRLFTDRALAEIAIGCLITRAETAAIAIAAQYAAYTNQGSTTGTM